MIIKLINEIYEKSNVSKFFLFSPMPSSEHKRWKARRSADNSSSRTGEILRFLILSLISSKKGMSLNTSTGKLSRRE